MSYSYDMLEDMDSRGFPLDLTPRQLNTTRVQTQRQSYLAVRDVRILRREDPSNWIRVGSHVRQGGDWIGWECSVRRFFHEAPPRFVLAWWRSMIRSTISTSLSTNFG